MTGGRTLFDKLWDDHVILTREDGESLLWVDRHFVHEGSHHAFRKLDERGAAVAEPVAAPAEAEDRTRRVQGAFFFCGLAGRVAAGATGAGAASTALRRPSWGFFSKAAAMPMKRRSRPSKP